jgi:cytochrome c-type biogenesis protein CcmF
MTSIPVYNTLLSNFGIKSRLAPPADQVKFYGEWQLWFSVFIALLSGTAQFFYWKKIDRNLLGKVMYWPVIITLLLDTVIILVGDVNNPVYMVLLTVSVYSIVANGTILWSLFKSNVKLAGGSIAHIGIGLMLIGILFSAGYSKVVSLNNSGLLYSKEFSEEMNRENILLFANEPQKMGNYNVTFLGSRIEASGFPGYVDNNVLEFSSDPSKAVALEPIIYKGKTYFNPGDTLKVYPENTYYEVVFEDTAGGSQSLFPRAQVNPQMGLIASPDILKTTFYDLYTHVSSIPDPEKDKKWSDREEFQVTLGDTFFVNDYVAILEKVERINKIQGIDLGAEDVAVRAKVKVLAENRAYFLNPTFVIKNKLVGIIPDTKTEIGLRLGLANIDPANQKFTFYSSTSQKDWVILKSVKKPLINLLWIGSLLVIVGFLISIFRRYTEFSLMREKGEEVREYTSV